MASTAIAPIETSATSNPKLDAKDRNVLVKASSLARDLGELSRDNASACATFGKIAFSSLKKLGKANMVDAKSSFTLLCGDLKELTTAQSPVDFYRLQGTLLQNSLKAAIAFNTRNREALFDLVADASAPLKQQMQKVTAQVSKSVS